MIFGYDVFRRLHDGSPLWVGTVANVVEAEKQIQNLATQSRDNFFIREAINGEITHYLNSAIRKRSFSERQTLIGRAHRAQ
jgi:hypothetical protein